MPRAFQISKVRRLAVFSLLLFGCAIMACWVRSYWARDAVGLPVGKQRLLRLSSREGVITVSLITYPTNAPRAFWQEDDLAELRQADARVRTVTGAGANPSYGYSSKNMIFGGGPMTMTKVSLPYWLATMLPSALAALCIVRDRRRRRRDATHCRKCHYNLTGNVSGRCPECGAEAPKY